MLWADSDLYFPICGIFRGKRDQLPPFFSRRLPFVSVFIAAQQHGPVPVRAANRPIHSARAALRSAFKDHGAVHTCEFCPLLYLRLLLWKKESRGPRLFSAGRTAGPGFLRISDRPGHAVPGKGNHHNDRGHRAVYRRSRRHALHHCRLHCDPYAPPDPVCHSSQKHLLYPGRGKHSENGGSSGGQPAGDQHSPKCGGRHDSRTAANVRTYLLPGAGHLRNLNRHGHAFYHVSVGADQFHCRHAAA